MRIRAQRIWNATECSEARGRYADRGAKAPLSKFKTSLVAAALAAFAFPAFNSAATAAESYIGAHGGTLGLGVTFGIDMSEQFSGRAMLNGFEQKTSRTDSGNKYDGKLKFESYGVLLDWHPLSNAVRLTGGAFINNNELDVSTSGSGEVDIGGKKYSDFSLKSRLDFETLAPYVGIGLTTNRSDDSGLVFSLDVGVLFQGTPNLSLSGNSGDNCSFSASSSGVKVALCDNSSTLESDLQKEYDSVTTEIKDFKLWPVVSAGISYRF